MPRMPQHDRGQPAVSPDPPRPRRRSLEPLLLPLAATHPLLQSRPPAGPAAGQNPLPEELLEEYQNSNYELELARRRPERPDRSPPDHAAEYTANSRLNAAEQMITLGDHAAVRFIRRTLGDDAGISQANVGRLHDLRQAISNHSAGRLNRMLQEHPNPAADAALNGAKTATADF